MIEVPKREVQSQRNSNLFFEEEKKGRKLSSKKSATPKGILNHVIPGFRQEEKSFQDRIQKRISESIVLYEAQLKVEQAINHLAACISSENLLSVGTNQRTIYPPPPPIAQSNDLIKEHSSPALIHIPMTNHLDEIIKHCSDPNTKD